MAQQTQRDVFLFFFVFLGPGAYSWAIRSATRGRGRDSIGRYRGNRRSASERMGELKREDGWFPHGLGEIGNGQCGRDIRETGSAEGGRAAQKGRQLPKSGRGEAGDEIRVRPSVPLNDAARIADR